MSSMPPATTGVAMGSSRSGRPPRWDSGRWAARRDDPDRPSELDADAIRDTPDWPTSQAQAWGMMAARPSERRTRHRCRWDSASVCWAIAGAAQCAFGHGEVVVHQVEFGVHDVVTWLLEKRDYLPHTPGRPVLLYRGEAHRAPAPALRLGTLRRGGRSRDARPHRAAAAPVAEAANGPHGAAARARGVLVMLAPRDHREGLEGPTARYCYDHPYGQRPDVVGALQRQGARGKGRQARRCRNDGSELGLRGSPWEGRA